MSTEHHVNFAATGPSTPPLQKEGGMLQSGNTEMRLDLGKGKEGEATSDEIPFSRSVPRVCRTGRDRK